MPSRWDVVNVDASAMRCYVGKPEGGGPFPGVVVIQHAGGVDAFIQEMTDRFAGEGFAAISPDLYHREDPNASDDALTRMSRLRDRNIETDVLAAIGHLKKQTYAIADRLGITGFCMGGRVAYLMAARSPDVRACVVFYGGNIMVPWGQSPAPFELSEGISAPILGLFGKEDQNPNPADVEKIDRELTRLGKVHEFHSYDGAGHAFMGRDRPSYREEAAKDAWTRCTGWFDRHLR